MGRNTECPSETTACKKTLLANPAQRWNTIIFRQVHREIKKNKYSACLSVLAGSIQHFLGPSQKVAVAAKAALIVAD